LTELDRLLNFLSMFLRYDKEIRVSSRIKKIKGNITIHGSEHDIGLFSRRFRSHNQSWKEFVSSAFIPSPVLDRADYEFLRNLDEFFPYNFLEDMHEKCLPPELLSTQFFVSEEEAKLRVKAIISKELPIDELADLFSWKDSEEGFTFWFDYVKRGQVSEILFKNLFPNDTSKPTEENPPKQIDPKTEKYPKSFNSVITDNDWVITDEVPQMQFYERLRFLAPARR
jgi:hypothetical protein